MEDSRRRAKIESGIKPDALFMQKSPIMVTYPTLELNINEFKEVCPCALSVHWGGHTAEESMEEQNHIDRPCN